MSWIKFFRALFHPEGGSADLYERFHEMLRIGNRMFALVSAPLFDATAAAPTRPEVKALDGELNRLEDEVRQRLLTAVAVNPEQDTAARLLLLGLVKDAERCGDFVKHLFDVFEQSGGALPDCAHTTVLREQRDFILRLFDAVWDVYDAGDQERARALLVEARSFSLRDKAIVRALLEEDGSPRPAALALAARFFKRVQAHLAHIVQASVIPGEAQDSPARLPEEDL